MSHVVFLRAANVGGHNVFRPTLLVAALKHLDVTNIGAAGTFVVHTKTTATGLRDDFLANLPFQPEVIVRPAKEIMAFVESDPFRDEKFSKGVRGWVGALSGKPTAQPTLPFLMPGGDKWSMRIDRVAHPFAMGLWRRQPGGFVIPANAAAKALGVSMTVRWWETFVRIAKVIEKRSSRS